MECNSPTQAPPPPHPPSHSFGLLCAILSALTSSVATVCYAVAAKEMSLLALGTLSGGVGGMLLLVQRRMDGAIPLDLLTAHWRAILVNAVLRGGIGSILFILALQNTSAIKIVFFTKIEPYFVMFWGWVLWRERANVAEVFLLTIHLAGAYLLSAGSDLSTVGDGQLGDLLIILAMLLNAYTYRSSRDLSEKIGARLSAAACSIIGSAIIFVVGSLFLQFGDPWAASARGWSFLAADIVLFNILALPLWYQALRSVKGWTVSAMRAVGPLFGAPAAYLILGETLDLFQLIGAIAVVVTSALIGRVHLRSKSTR